MTRPLSLGLTVSIILVLAVAPAGSQTWTNGAPSGDWNTAANWSPASVPNSPTANVNFTGLGLGAVIISSSIQAQSLTFSNPTSKYIIETLGSLTLSSLTAINVAPGVTGDNEISPVNLLFAAGTFVAPDNLTITNNSTAANTSLVINNTTAIGTPGTGGVIFAGPGNSAIIASFAAPGSGTNVIGGLTKTGPGTLNFGGDGSNLGGGLTLSGGTLQLEYSTNTASKLGLGALTLNGGVLTLIPNQNTTVIQTIPGGTIVNAGHTDVQASPGGAITLAAGGITHNVGATVDFSPAANGGPIFAITTSTTNTNLLLGTGPAFATALGGTTWATSIGGAITGLSTYGADTYSAGTNTDVTTSASLPGITTNSLRFNSGAPTLTLAGDLILQSGGILVTPSAFGGLITGGTLKATGNGELLVHHYGSGTFTINSALVSSVGLTKTGPGILALGGNNSGLTGPINVNRGYLDVTSPAAVNSASQINFNDIRSSTAYGGLQGFLFDLGDNMSGTISPPILVSTYSPNDYGTYFVIGFDHFSVVTLSGVISSAPGQTTPIRFYGNTIVTSGFNLTNANTFTGNISLINGGILGITSDASLGNPANVLALESGNTAGGGLVFLNGGVTVARPIVVNLPTRIASNGTDSNTISGPISGTGGLYKDGTGTLTILNSNNSVTGGVTVAAGTLSLGATGGLPAGTNVTVVAGAKYTPGTSPNGNNLGTLTLNGGTFRASTGAVTTQQVMQIVTGPAGGTLDLTGADFYAVDVYGAAAAITVNGNSTWVSPANYAAINNVNTADIPITIPAGVTLNNGIALGTQLGYGFRVTGGGTLYQNCDAITVRSLDAALTVAQSTFRVTDASSNGGTGNLGLGSFTLDGGTFSYGGTTTTMNKPVFLTANGGIIQVESAATTLTVNDPIVGPGGLTKSGPGTLLLPSLSDSLSSLSVNAGTVQTYQDAALGTGPVTINPFGTLTYLATTTTARTITMFGGTLSVGGQATLTMNGAAVGNGFLAGPGTIAVTGGTLLTGVTTFASTVVSVTGAGSFTNFTNGGALDVAAGLAAPIALTRFTNQGSGAITIGAVSKVNVSDFQTYGTLTLNPAVVGSNTFTELVNTGSSPLYFDGGSRTFLGNAATANSGGSPSFVAGIDLHGQNAVIAGGLFINNGFVVDTTNSGANLIVDYGALYKGAGYTGVPIITQNGGKVQAGNSPGSASFGRFVFGPGGVSNYVFAIDDATGTAGPSPDAAGHVSGWGLIKAIQQSVGPVTSSGDFTWTATPADKLTVALDTLVNPTTVGTDVAGAMADFNPNSAYSWPAAQWAGTYSGPTNAASLDAATSFDTSGFVNPVSGTFGWNLDPAGQALSLVYTPSSVPEPGTLVLVGLAAAGLACWRRRGQPTSRPHPGPA